MEYTFLHGQRFTGYFFEILKKPFGRATTISLFVFENEGIDCLFTGGFLLETQAEVTYTFDFCDIISTKVLSINLIFQQEYKNPGCNAFMGKLFV